MLRNEGEITDDWEWEYGEDNGEISKWEEQFYKFIFYDIIKKIIRRKYGRRKLF